jgi:hypothetical protein
MTRTIRFDGQAAIVTGAEEERALESSFEELSLYWQEFPFEGRGGGPAPDDRAVVGATLTQDGLS